ncbi:DUF2388 domain-containing protein [Bdellovibrio sp. HCB290]|uniref:DUF2388 domain-containing protein n=1 Tax=Bdellovibrio sp. HCB290 TaxID=3394356 RepID=UPI0039B66FE0
MFTKKMVIFTAILTSSTGALALDGKDAAGAVAAATTMAPIWTVAGPFLTTKKAMSNEQYKVLVDAKDDAAIFLGTDGEVRGVSLQRALELVRTAQPKAAVSDMEIAEAILAL